MVKFIKNNYLEPMGFYKSLIELELGIFVLLVSFVVSLRFDQILFRIEYRE